MKAYMTSNACAQTRRDSEEHETANAIIAEMRNEFNKSWHDIDREWAHDLADRLEAAVRYERERLCKEMDEAAEHINSYLNE